MAALTITTADGEVSATATLAAATVDTVTIDRDCDRIVVVNEDGAAKISVTVDGSTPTVGGKKTYPLPASIGRAVISVPSSGNTVVKLISAGTPKYSVVVQP